MATVGISLTKGTQHKDPANLALNAPGDISVTFKHVGDQVALLATAVADNAVVVADEVVFDADWTAVKSEVSIAQGTHKTAFEAALATLVADGALPTQAHVTAVDSAYTSLKTDIEAISTTTGDTDWGTLKTDLATSATDIGAVSLAGDVLAIYDNAVITTKNQLRRLLETALQAVQGNGTLT